MQAAGEKERELAIQQGSFHRGVPAITVIVDAGWSKRTHKHTYNALSGVGVIFGQQTGKLLIWACVTNSVQLVKKAQSIHALKIGKKPHPQWKQTSFLQDFRQLKNNMVYVT